MREKTNSITHLVKIIAEEVFEEKFGTLQIPPPTGLLGRIEVIEDFIKINVKPPISNEGATTYSGDVNAGKPWSDFEDDVLAREFAHTLRILSERHGRTIGAIRERIKVNLK